MPIGNHSTEFNVKEILGGLCLSSSIYSGVGTSPAKSQFIGGTIKQNYFLSLIQVRSTNLSPCFISCVFGSVY